MPDTGQVTVSAFKVPALSNSAVPEAMEEVPVVCEELGGTCSTHCHHQQRGLAVSCIHPLLFTFEVSLFP